MVILFNFFPCRKVPLVKFINLFLDDSVILNNRYKLYSCKLGYVNKTVPFYNSIWSLNHTTSWLLGAGRNWVWRRPEGWPEAGCGQSALALEGSLSPGGKSVTGVLFPSQIPSHSKNNFVTYAPSTYTKLKERVREQGTLFLICILFLIS